jgi:hypothetical protein
MVEIDWSRAALYGSGWLLLLLGGREWSRQRGKPIPVAYLILVGILIVLQLYSELGFNTHEHPP